MCNAQPCSDLVVKVKTTSETKWEGDRRKEGRKENPYSGLS